MAGALAHHRASKISPDHQPEPQAGCHAAPQAPLALQRPPAAAATAAAAAAAVQSCAGSDAAAPLAPYYC
eukprot:1156715-Pelagomonas_calceolata.AAC.1